MGTRLFKDEERIKKYDENRKRTEEGWALSRFTGADDAIALRLVRALQVHHAGVIIVADNVPVGSGVLVRGSKGHGILTAGHVCTVLRDAIREQRPLACISQGLREPVRPGEASPVQVRHLPTQEMKEVYTKDSPVPDYGCIVVPAVDAPSMRAWGTFINITRDGPSRKQRKDYDLNHNAWLAAGLLEERRPYPASVYQFNGIGAPEAVYERAGKRYLFIEAQQYAGQDDLPESMGGMSGSGLWEMPVLARQGQSADEWEIGTPILRGIVFWQERPESDGAPLAFYAHELETIADDVVSWLDAVAVLEGGTENANRST